MDGDDVMPDDNLGVAICNIGEIHGQGLEPKAVIDFKSRKLVRFSTRMGTFNKKFTSSRFDASPISITFSIFFLPDLEKEFDLQEFLHMQITDSYPPEIAPKMQEK
jgi:hypothetical protein